MPNEERPSGHWGGYSFTHGFGQSELLSEEARQEYITQMRQPDLDISSDIQELRDQIDELNNDLPRWLTVFPCEIESGEMGGVRTTTVVPATWAPRI